MGLFTKVTCAICGKETRFSKTKLADGNYICGNCLGETYYMHDVFQGINASTKLDYKKMTLNDIKLCYEIRKQNLSELETFKCTQPLGSNIHLDEYNHKVIFVDYFLATSQKKLLEKNPPVFKLKNLTYIDVEFSQDKESMTVTGKPTVESQAFLILKFDDPVYDSFKIEIGKLKAKSGLLFDKVTGDKKIKNILDTITAARDAAIEYDLQN